MKTLTVMSALQTLIEKSKAKQSTFFELLGFVVLSAGIFCGLALFTYDPGDPTQITTTGETYRNMGGPVGAWLANSLLSTLGMVSLLIAIVLFFCGALMALGFIRWPKPKRVEYLLFLLQRLGSQPSRNGKRRIASLANSVETPAQANGENGKRTALSLSADEGDEDDIDIPLDLTSTVPRNPKPDPNMFQASKVNASRKTDFSLLVKQLEGQLREFKIEGKITNVTEGPVVTTLEYEPGAGTKAARIVSIANDIARMLRWAV